MANTQQPTWMSYEPTKDCTLGLCSMYCPQWCYIIFPPPPTVEFSDDSSSPALSPLVIGIIVILASAFLLVCYYTLVSKYCGTFSSLWGRQRSSSGPGNQRRNEADNWPASDSPSAGLDETLINKITVCKYRKGSGIVDASDCSVCLGEFKNDERLRLLPKCGHAFHVKCIDTWLKSHSNCPLCRANVTPVSSATTMSVTESSCPVDQHVARHHEVSVPREEAQSLNTVQQMQGRAETVIEIREDDSDDIEAFTPSLSLDSSPCGRVLIADVLQRNAEDEVTNQGEPWASSTSSSSSSSRQGNKNRGQHCVNSPASAKKSVTRSRSIGL